MSGPASISLDRFLGLVVRELHADAAELAPDDAPEGPTTLRHELPDGRAILVRFGTPPEDRDALRERLATLVATFGDGIGSEEPQDTRPPRLPLPMALHEELRDLASRADATDAVVIDAHSPVVWGSANVSFLGAALVRTAEVDAALAYAERTRHELLDMIRRAATEAAERTGDATEALQDLTQLALRDLRAHPSLELLRKGRPFREKGAVDGASYLAHSFAAIYLVVLVYAGDFDELRAERALHECIPRIERLVLALPPLDPEPLSDAGVVRFPRRRR